ncbi:MAG: nicotinate (nicotinamide) nucleotide adenylyltransferase [Deltaproteobacteria bacterium]
MTERIGIYGGSFNPVHFGHLRCAEEVRERCGLASIRLVPARMPPHKDAAGIAPAEHRVAMLERAVENTPGLEVDPLELSREGPSYTIDTLRELRRRTPEATFALIVGLDTFREFHTWKDYEKIFEEADLIVTSRPPDAVAEAENVVIYGRLPIAVTRAFCYDESVRCYTHHSGHRLEFLPVTGLDISASAIRGALAQGRSARYLLPQKSLAYLEEHRLYQGKSSPE